MRASTQSQQVGQGVREVNVGCPLPWVRKEDRLFEGKHQSATERTIRLLAAIQKSSRQTRRQRNVADYTDGGVAINNAKY